MSKGVAEKVEFLPDMSFSLAGVDALNQEENRTVGILNEIRATSERLAHNSPSIYTREKAEAYVGMGTPDQKLHAMTHVGSDQLVRNARRMLKNGGTPSVGKLSTRGETGAVKPAALDHQEPVSHASNKSTASSDTFQADMTFTLEETEAAPVADVIEEVVTWKELEGPKAGLAVFLDPEREAVFLPGHPGVKVNYRFERDLSSAEAGTELQSQVVPESPMEGAVASVFHKLGL